MKIIISCSPTSWITMMEAKILWNKDQIKVSDCCLSMIRNEREMIRHVDTVMIMCRVIWITKFPTLPVHNMIKSRRRLKTRIQHPQWNQYGNTSSSAKLPVSILTMALFTSFYSAVLTWILRFQLNDYMINLFTCLSVTTDYNC